MPKPVSHFAVVHCPKGYAKFAPLIFGHAGDHRVFALEIGIKHHGVAGCSLERAPKPAFDRAEGGEHMGDTGFDQGAGHGERWLVDRAIADLEEIGRSVARHNPIDPGGEIVADRQKLDTIESEVVLLTKGAGDG